MFKCPSLFPADAISVCRNGAATSPTDVLNGKKTQIFAGSPAGSARTSVAKLISYAALKPREFRDVLRYSYLRCFALAFAMKYLN
jgi:hypothetical protein